MVITFYSCLFLDENEVKEKEKEKKWMKRLGRGNVLLYFKHTIHSCTLCTVHCIVVQYYHETFTYMYVREYFMVYTIATPTIMLSFIF